MPLALPLPRAHPPAPGPRLQQAVAWGVVVALHVLFASGLLQGVRLRNAPDAEDRLALRWLPPVPPALPAPPTALDEALPRPTTGRTTTHRPPRPAEAQSAPAAPPSPLPAVAAAPLDLQLRSGSVPGGDGITAEGVAARLIGRREVHPAFAPQARRFRIRPQMTPEQIVQGVAQLLQLWPPGYRVDPCMLGRQDMAYFQDAVDESDRQLLREAVHQVRARCR